MITDKGKQIIGKYLLGQAPEYAAYIAVGTGANPTSVWSTAEEVANEANRMQFEAFRVPVLSRGLVNDTISILGTAIDRTSNVVTITVNRHGLTVGDSVTVAVPAPNDSESGTFSVTSTTSTTFTYDQTGSDFSTTEDFPVTYVKERLIFKAQLPPDQFYGMTEIALFPAANNQLALGYDSKPMAGFVPTEGWVLRYSEDTNLDYITTSVVDIDGIITAASACYVHPNNDLFNNRTAPRFMNRSLLVPGSLTEFADDTCAIADGAGRVQTGSLAFDFSKNSPYDEITLAMLVVPADVGTDYPAKIRVRLDLIDGFNGGRATAYRTMTSWDNDYFTVSWLISEFLTDTSPFNWSRITSVEVFVETLDEFDVYNETWMVLDGLRFDNTQTLNPLYGLVAYSEMDGETVGNVFQAVEKQENTQGYVEYRMGVSIT